MHSLKSILDLLRTRYLMTEREAKMFIDTAVGKDQANPLSAFRKREPFNSNLLCLPRISPYLYLPVIVPFSD
jgi:hypothetical protein